MDIQFIYSHQYENFLNKGEKPSSDLVVDTINQLESFWKLYGQQVIDSFEFFLGVSFDFPTILKCYVNSIGSISDPLSLKIEDIDNMFDNLVHELIHALFTQQYHKIEKGWWEIRKKYTSENVVTRNHIPVHALHYLVTEKVIPHRLKNIMTYSKKPEYTRSWEIVMEETPEKIMVVLKPDLLK